MISRCLNWIFDRIYQHFLRSISSFSVIFLLLFNFFGAVLVCVSFEKMATVLATVLFSFSMRQKYTYSFTVWQYWGIRALKAQSILCTVLRLRFYHIFERKTIALGHIISTMYFRRVTARHVASIIFSKHAHIRGFLQRLNSITVWWKDCNYRGPLR